MAARVLRPRNAVAPSRLQDWVKTRPPRVQALAHEFPPGIVITDEAGDDWYVMGYTEDDQLIIVPFWPWQPGLDEHANHNRYNRATQQKQYVCASHLRDGSVPVKRQERAAH